MSNSLQGFDVRAATFAADVEQAFWVNFWISIVLFLSVVAPMIYFAWKYNANKVKNEDVENVTHNTALEIAWTLIPTAMLMVLFYYGYTSMQVLRTMPAESESIVVKVEGLKWQWRYEYPANANGHIHKIGGAFQKPKIDDKGKVIEKGTMGITALYVPVNTNVILEMSAPKNDVIHSFFVPAFRMKEDVVPGRTTKQWFNATEVGEYDIECAEYCGTDHSYMYSRLVVLPQKEYDAWFNSAEDTPKGNFTKTGDALLQRHGCTQCHSILTDEMKIGPSLKTRLSKEQVLHVIEKGQNKLGYDMGAMPAGLATGTDAQEIAAYVAGGLKGEKPASFAACTACHGEDGRGMGGLSPDLVGYDATLLGHVFKNGKEGMIGRMPAFPEIPEDEISAIAKYLENIGK